MGGCYVQVIHLTYSALLRFLTCLSPQQYYREIARAATRLRGIHIGLSRRLNQWLQHDAVETSPDQIDDFIDPELGITFNDFQDALRLLTVKETKQEEGLFLISDLGQLSKGENYE